MDHRASTFLRAEAGAVTVDWVVLTAALVGLGLAVLGVVSTGVQAASNETSGTLSGIEIKTRFDLDTFASLLDTDFSGGAAGWIGGAVETLAGFGEVFVVDNGGEASFLAEVPADATQATVAFSLIGGDDLRNEPATVSINGVPVSIYTDNAGNVSVSGADVDGITVTTTQLYSNDPVGAGDYGHDSRIDYTITVDDPDATLLVGVASGVDAGATDRFFAIDDVTITRE